MAGDLKTRHPSKPQTDSFPFMNATSGLPKEEKFRNIQLQTLKPYIYIYIYIYTPLLLFTISLFSLYALIYKYRSKYGAVKLNLTLPHTVLTLACQLVHRHVTVHVQ